MVEVPVSLVTAHPPLLGEGLRLLEARVFVAGKQEEAIGHFFRRAIDVVDALVLPFHPTEKLIEEARDLLMGLFGPVLGLPMRIHLTN